MARGRLLCAEGQQVQPSQLRRNAVYHVVDGVFFFAAMALFSAEVVIPAMISELSDSALLLALVPFLMWVCTLAPQILFTRKVERLPYKKRVVAFTSLLQRLGWLILLISFFLHWGSPLTLVVFYLMLASVKLSTGLVIPVWSDWYAKTTPEPMWGRLLGIRRAVFGVLALGLGPLIKWVMDTFPTPQRYQILLGAAVLCYWLSYGAVLLVHEDHEESPHGSEPLPLRHYLGDAFWILFRRRDFRRFLLGCMLTVIPLTLLATFLTRYGLLAPGVDRGITGTFTICFFTSTAVGALLAGSMTDRLGPMAPFRVFPLLAFASAVVAAASGRPAAVSAAFVLHGLAMGMRMVVVMPAVFRYSGPHRRALYMAVTFTCLGVANALIPLVAGVVLDAGWADFRQVFLGCGAIALAGWLLLLSARIPDTASHSDAHDGPSSEKLRATGAAP